MKLTAGQQRWYSVAVCSQWHSYACWQRPQPTSAGMKDADIQAAFKKFPEGLASDVEERLKPNMQVCTLQIVGARSIVRRLWAAHICCCHSSSSDP